MLTFAQTPGNSNQAVYVIRMKLDTSTVYVSTKELSFLSENLLLKNSFRRVLKSLNLETGGTIGFYSNIQFSFINHSDNSVFSAFMNAIFPATDIILFNRLLDIGFCWNDATSVNDITWFQGYFIKNYSINSAINIQCIERPVLDLKLIPRNKLQHTIEDYLSYFPDSREFKIGEILPLTYGRFTFDTLTTYNHQFPQSSPLAPILEIKYRVFDYFVSEDQIHTFLYLDRRARQSTDSSIPTGNTDSDIYYYDDVFGLYQPAYLFNTSTDAVLSDGIQEDNFAHFLLSAPIRSNYVLYTDPAFWFTAYDDDDSGITFNLNDISNMDESKYVDLATGANMRLKFVKDSYDSFKHLTEYNSNTKTWFMLYVENLDEDGIGADLHFIRGGLDYNISTWAIAAGTKQVIYLHIPQTIGAGPTFDLADSWDALLNGIFYIDNVTSSGTPSLRIYSAWMIVSKIEMKNAVRGKIQISSSIRNSGERPGRAAKVLDRPDLSADDQQFFIGLIGRKFRSWIDRASNSLAVTDVIEHPVYLIESLLRDEIHTEKNLIVSSVTADDPETILEIESLAINQADYYNGAYFYHLNSGVYYLVNDYDNTTNLLTIANPSQDIITAGDLGFLFNVDINLDAENFDDVAINFRPDWIVRRHFGTEESSDDILESLAFDLFCLLDRNSMTSYRLKPIEKKNLADAIFNNPLKADGDAMIKVNFTDPSFLNNRFELDYNFDYATNTYKSRFTIDKNNCSDAAMDAEYKTLCKNVEEKYRVKDNPWIGSSKNHYDASTVRELMKLIIRWKTFIHGLIEYHGDLETHGKYAVGDQVKIDYKVKVPTKINKYASFIITHREDYDINSVPKIRFEMIQTINKDGIADNALMDRDGNFLKDRDNNYIYARWTS
jgi:hypothetical protein